MSWLFRSNEPTLEQIKITLLEAENDRLRRQVQDYHDALRKAERAWKLCSIRSEKQKEAWQQMCAASLPVFDLVRDQVVPAINHLESTIDLNEVEPTYETED
jgi:16S rRNA G527 N7-methylase RsmG